MTGWSVVNAGVPGETAAQGCARLPALLGEHRARLVVVLLGGNDFLRRLPERGVRADPIHLNAEGYRAMAAQVAEGLRRTGLLAR